jgi:hypothetical protein
MTAKQYAEQNNLIQHIIAHFWLSLKAKKSSSLNKIIFSNIIVKQSVGVPPIWHVDTLKHIQ